MRRARVFLCATLSVIAVFAAVPARADVAGPVLVIPSVLSWSMSLDGSSIVGNMTLNSSVPTCPGGGPSQAKAYQTGYFFFFRTQQNDLLNATNRCNWRTARVVTFNNPPVSTSTRHTVMGLTITETGAWKLNWGLFEPTLGYRMFDTTNVAVTQPSANSLRMAIPYSGTATSAACGMETYALASPGSTIVSAGAATYATVQGTVYENVI